MYAASIVLLLLLVTAASAQTLHDGYAPNPNAEVLTLAVQPDGKLIVGGKFTNVAGQTRHSLTRLLIDGTIDPSFAPVAVNNWVQAVAIQPTGHIVIGGYFSQVGSCACPGLARLHPNGNVDSGWVPQGTAGGVLSLAVQADGKVVAGGEFTKVRGTTRNRIARLNANGTLDTSFNPTGGANAAVYSVAIQRDGKIFTGGAFTQIAGDARNRIARLNHNGSIDTSFNPSGGANGTVRSIAIEVDGRIAVGGSFTQIAGAARNRIARLNAKGVVSTFYPSGGANGAVSTIAIQSDGKWIIGGDFTQIGGQGLYRLARLNLNGSVDTGLNLPGGASGVNAKVNAIAVHQDGKIVAGGSFSYMGNVPRSNLARLNVDGSVEVDFQRYTEYNQLHGGVYGMAVQPDGKTVMYGNFSMIDGASRRYIARLNADGSLDSSFQPPGSTDYHIRAVAPREDRRVVAVGHFEKLGFVARNYIGQFKADGTIDQTFSSPSGGADDHLWSVALLPGGKSLVAGNFTTIDGVTSHGIARLNVDGSIDPGFIQPGALSSAGDSGAIYNFFVQPDGKIVIGGYFDKIGSATRKNIARLNADGSLDTSFMPLGANNIVSVFAPQSDGKILVGGYFDAIGGILRTRIARLHPDGTVDTSFNLPGGVDSAPYSILPQANGKIWLGGWFHEAGGQTRHSLALLNSNGSLDPSFNPPGGADDVVWGLSTQADGKLLVSGQFKTIGGETHNQIARLPAREAALQSLSVEDGTIHWRLSGSSPIFAHAPEVWFSYSGTPGSQVRIGVMERTADGWRLQGFSTPKDRAFSLRVHARTGSGHFNGASDLFEYIQRLYVPSCPTADGIFCDGFE